MRLGKLSNEQLEALVLSKFKKTRPESLGAPQIGEDCAALDFQGDLIELSTDPITSARINTIGALTVHVSCNDAAAAGADPVALMVTLLAPPSATEAEIGRIADDLAAAAKSAGVDIVGGHTEVTDAVTRYVTNTTVIARIARDRILPGPSAGDEIVMTKWAGLEGSAIIASDYPERLSALAPGTIRRACDFSSLLSVVPEGRIAAKNGATAMHDVTEGGVFGAVWELCERLSAGVELDLKKIPICQETVEICEYFDVNPYQLKGDGALLFLCHNSAAVIKALKEAGISAAVIGRITDSNDRVLINEEETRFLEPNRVDEYEKARTFERK